MRLGDLPPSVLAGRLRSGRLLLPLGPFTLRLASPMADLATAIGRGYRHHAALPHDAFADVHLQVRPGPGLRRWLGSGAEVLADGVAMGRGTRPQAARLLEQVIDTWVAHHAQPWLAVRIAAVARGGMALLLAGTESAPAAAAADAAGAAQGPAMAEMAKMGGMGDTTDSAGLADLAERPPAGAPRSSQWLARALCGALLNDGWRLLGEGLVLYDPDSGLLHGLPRPLRPPPGAPASASLQPPPADSVQRAAEPAWPTWLVRVEAAAPASGALAGLAGFGSSAAFMALAARTHRWAPTGPHGVRALGSLVDQCACHHLRLGSLAQGVSLLQHLTREAPCAEPARSA